MSYNFCFFFYFSRAIIPGRIVIEWTLLLDHDVKFITGLGGHRNKVERPLEFM